MSENWLKMVRVVITRHKQEVMGSNPALLDLCLPYRVPHRISAADFQRNLELHTCATWGKTR